jgi:hypothetical protein
MENQATPFGPFALEKNRQLTAKNTLLFELVVANTGATDFFVQLWDVAAVGAIAGAPDYELSVPAGSFLPFAWPGGYQFHNGVYVRCVTALGGSTAIATSDAKFSGRYITPFPIAT